jgi:hypothetical protein
VDVTSVCTEQYNELSNVVIFVGDTQQMLRCKRWTVVVSIPLLHPKPLAVLCHMLGCTQLTCSHLASLLVGANMC